MDYGNLGTASQGAIVLILTVALSTHVVRRVRLIDRKFHIQEHMSCVPASHVLDAMFFPV